MMHFCDASVSLHISSNCVQIVLQSSATFKQLYIIMNVSE